MHCITILVVSKRCCSLVFRFCNAFAAVEYSVTTNSKLKELLKLWNQFASRRIAFRDPGLRWEGWQGLYCYCPICRTRCALCAFDLSDHKMIVSKVFCLSPTSPVSMVNMSSSFWKCVFVRFVYKLESHKSKLLWKFFCLDWETFLPEVCRQGSNIKMFEVYQSACL